MKLDREENSAALPPESLRYCAAPESILLFGFLLSAHAGVLPRFAIAVGAFFFVGDDGR
jgi:hypothetical protein